jgi:hypothetical protein
MQRGKVGKMHGAQGVRSCCAQDGRAPLGCGFAALNIQRLVSTPHPDLPMHREVRRDAVEPILPLQGVREQRVSSHLVQGKYSLRSPRSARKRARRTLAPPKVHGPDALPKCRGVLPCTSPKIQGRHGWRQALSVPNLWVRQSLGFMLPMFFKKMEAVHAPVVHTCILSLSPRKERTGRESERGVRFARTNNPPLPCPTLPSSSAC